MIIIPKIYDTERIIRALGIDGEQKLVRINSEDPQGWMDGQKRAYDFSYGKYDVVVSTGPSYETKRQEAREEMIAMAQASPKFSDVSMDLIAKNMDWPGSQEIAERLKKTLPPEIAGSEDDEIPPQAQAAIAQLTQRLELVTQEFQALKEVQDKDLLKIQSDERKALMKIEADYRMKLLDIEGEEYMTMVQAELDQINKRMEMLNQPQQNSVENTNNVA